MKKPETKIYKEEKIKLEYLEIISKKLDQFINY